MTNLNYYLWLQNVLGMGAKNVELIFETYHSAEEIFKDSSYARRISNVFTETQLNKMESSFIEDTYKTVELCASQGVDIVSCHDKMYPEYLKQISDYPVLLYVKGNLDALKRKIPIAIVGTRKATARSVTAATELAKALSKCGFAIVSGGALGVDSAAHTGAISVGEETFAVLGSGHGAKYLKSNEPLRNVISNCGATISEYPPLTEPFQGSFPTRNRIISGMTVGTVVVEAHEGSGSLITARYATEQGRDVFALPGVNLGKATRGGDMVIEDGGDAVVMSLDIVGRYLTSYPDKIVIDESVDLSIDLTKLGCEIDNYNREVRKIRTLHSEIEKEKQRRNKPQKREITDSVSDNARRVYAAFGQDPLSINKLEDTMAMPLNDLLCALTELEIFGYVELLADTNYVIK